MAGKEEKDRDFYAVLGLKKECSPLELRNAYKKLALIWHPDRCSASGNSKHVEESKAKFQAIHEAYSVLSDANKRFLYDVGVYDSDDDENDMGAFLGEMAAMMRRSKPNGEGEESLEELQELFDEMFQRDMNNFGSTSCGGSSSFASADVTLSSSTDHNGCNSSGSHKRDCADMSMGKAGTASDFLAFEGGGGFCFGAETTEAQMRGGRSGSKRSRRKQKGSSRQDLSSQGAGISA